MSQEKMRKEFEAWYSAKAKNNYMHLDKVDDDYIIRAGIDPARRGEYVHAPAQEQWAAVLALIAENERLTGFVVHRREQADQYDEALTKVADQRDQLREDLQIANNACFLSIAENKKLKFEYDQLKTEIEELRENARRLAFIFMGEVDDGIESLEMDGRHSDSGYKKLKRLHRVAYRFVRRFVPLIKASQP